MKHINQLSIDLETYALTTDAVILQIAVAFVDQEGNMKSWSTPVNYDSQLQRYQDPETVAWWQKQSKEARDQVLLPAIDPKAPTLRDSLIALTTWLLENAKGCELWVWGNGASFDIGMLNHAYAHEGLRPPWHYRLERDQRTLEAIANLADIDLRWEVDERTGTHHEAKSDAEYQARRIHRIWYELNSWLVN